MKLQKIFLMLIFALSLTYAQTPFEDGKKKLENNDFLGAIKDLEKAVGQDKNNAQAYYQLGSAWYGLGNYQQAVKQYTQAITIKPTYPAAYASRASAFNSLGDHQAAIADCDKALIMDPSLPSMYISRSVGLFFSTRATHHIIFLRLFFRPRSHTFLFRLRSRLLSCLPGLCLRITLSSQ